MKQEYFQQLFRDPVGAETACRCEFLKAVRCLKSSEASRYGAGATARVVRLVARTDPRQGFRIIALGLLKETRPNKVE